MRRRRRRRENNKNEEEEEGTNVITMGDVIDSTHMPIN